VLSEDPRMLLVGKELFALYNGTFDPESAAFDPTWTPEVAPEVKPDQLCELILSELQPRGGIEISSKGMACNFVKLLCLLLPTAETWNVMDLRNLQILDPEWRKSKLYFTRWIVDTARLFASQVHSSSSSWWNICGFRIFFLLLDSHGLPQGCSCMTPPAIESSIDSGFCEFLAREQC